MMDFYLIGGAKAFYFFVLTLWLAFVSLGATHADIGVEANRQSRITANPRTIYFTPEQTFAGYIDGCMVGVLVLSSAMIGLTLLGSLCVYGFHLFAILSRCS